MDAFVCFELQADTPAAAEMALADAFEAGASGAEERDARATEPPTWRLYAPAGAAAAVARSLAAHAPGVRVEPPEPVPVEDWSERWKQGLEVVELSARLRIRPSFLPASAAPGQAEIVIDPAQAFGTGAHASTRLALAWIDTLAERLPEPTRVLDVGCGTGVLALAALRLGARRALGLDLDPLAARAARHNAAANALSERLDVLLGPIEALSAAPAFELVVANLLSGELAPVLAPMAARAAPGASLVLSGLLAAEATAVVSACSAVGLRFEAAREQRDANGDTWTALLMRR